MSHERISQVLKSLLPDKHLSSREHPICSLRMNCLFVLASLSVMIVLSQSNLPYTNHFLNVYRRSCLSVWRQLVIGAIRWAMPSALEHTIKTTLRGSGWLNDFFSPVLWLLLSICQRETRCSKSLLAKINGFCCCCFCSNSQTPASIGRCNTMSLERNIFAIAQYLVLSVWLSVCDCVCPPSVYFNELWKK